MRFFVILILLLAALPLGVVGALRYVPPPVTAFMLQSDVNPVRYEWVPLQEIAPVAGKAVIAAEDQKFWTHGGFDFEAIEKAYERNQKSRRKRGASTISQQTAKNLFLWPGGGYFRKGIEAYFTLLIEQLWPKKRILEVYLNIAEFGPGVYGVEAASQAFFRKPAARLQAIEAAQLAAVLPNPKRWSAGNPGGYVTKRRAWIMGQMGYRSQKRPVPQEEPIEPPESATPASASEIEVTPPQEVAPEAPVAPPEGEPGESEAFEDTPVEEQNVESQDVEEPPAEPDFSPDSVEGAAEWIEDEPLPDPHPEQELTP
jgi:monofunctional biosynthetic peptidoglycan transglycosylase